MQPLAIINVVGLCHEHLGPRTPHLTRLAADGFACPMSTVLPAVTCSAQATLLTGELPRAHGIVGNGWYCRKLSETLFWKQSNHLVSGERLYDAARARQPDYSVGKLFWWYNMYADVNWSVTPRPSYPADGLKLPDIYTQPADLRDELNARLGPFPLFQFWGPGANIASTRWIADSALEVLTRSSPSLLLVYLPHLDYNFQRLGPNDPRCTTDLMEVDEQAGRIISAAREKGYAVVALSEYALAPVHQPVHINRVLRESGWLATRRETLGWETLDAGASRAFAVADHQVAHVYVPNQADLSAVKHLLERTAGIERVLDRNEQAEFGIDHPRSGELVAVAAPEAWFTYYFWLDDALAPDYARTVDIHRKPGYDPVELVLNPELKLPKFQIARRVLKKKLGFRYLMDVIGLDARVIKGSHGRLPDSGQEETHGPVFVCSSKAIETDRMLMTHVKSQLLRLQFGI